MNLIGAIFGVAEQTLMFVNIREKRKYQDQLIKLKTEWYEEFNKDDSNRSDAVLDNLERKLCILLDAISSDLRAENTSNLQKP